MAIVAELGEYTKASAFSYCFLVLSFEMGSGCIVHAGFELKRHPASALSDEQRHAPPGPASFVCSF